MALFTPINIRESTLVNGSELPIYIPGFTPINRSEPPRNIPESTLVNDSELLLINKTSLLELNLYHASSFVQYLAEKSFHRLKQQTYAMLVKSAPYNDVEVKTHTTNCNKMEDPGDFLNGKEFAEWLRVTLIKLINRGLKEEDKEEIPPNEYQKIGLKLNLYHAFNFVQYLAEKSFHRLKLQTYAIIVKSAPYNEVEVKTHTANNTEDLDDFLSGKEFAEWLRVTLIELINRGLKEEDKAEISPDEYPYHKYE